MKPQTLRDLAEAEQFKGNTTTAQALKDAADSIEEKAADLWAINDELVKAGYKPWQYKSFAHCIADLRKKVQI